MAEIPRNVVQFDAPSLGEIEAAKANPGGWVYRIAGIFSREKDVPPEAIIGAWQVNSDGKIFGEFKQNPKYDPEKFPVGK
ncbi:hypothetical protein L1D59_07510 [Pseudoalteromonas piscicida]|uniref:hypothetical protein n=1 Tax=Pseudoalteromonas piscicida TaxID=43662 RepID=UPI001EFE03F2|nr:hypothetical protein [Pseudoalteromonas piscicida]MCG9768454.1 hypothetical protein [Pseudoalteromonas piscicida]